MTGLQISKCAGPNCARTWYRFGEGKLFTFYIKPSDSEPQTVKNVWLCESCFAFWKPKMHNGRQVEMVPVYEVSQNPSSTELP